VTLVLSDLVIVSAFEALPVLAEGVCYGFSQLTIEGIRSRGGELFLVCVRTITPALLTELYALAHTIQRNDAFRGKEKHVSEHFRTQREPA
jgi:hypothetical protein